MECKRTGKDGRDYLGNWADAKLIKRNISQAKGSEKKGIQFKGDSGSCYEITIPAGSDSRIARLYLGGIDARIKVEATIGFRQTSAFLEKTNGKTDGLFVVNYSSDQKEDLVLRVTLDKAYSSTASIHIEAITISNSK